MAFAVGRVLSWGGFLGFLGLFSIFVVKRRLVGVDGARGSCRSGKSGVWHDGVQGRGHAEEEKMSYGMTSMGTGTLEKEKQTKFRRFPPPPKRKIKKYYFSY